MPQAPYTVIESAVEPRLVAGVRARVARGRVGQEFSRFLDQVYAAGRAGSVQLDGQNVFIYRDCTDDQLTVDFCVGATAPFEPVGAVLPLYTPGGLAAKASPASRGSCCVGAATQSHPSRGRGRRTTDTRRGASLERGRTLVSGW